jgi:3-hydroxy-9,10-secoandrosta-1,3,5(10)-triene-9,17-dione monooxygenase reductase component
MTVDARHFRQALGQFATGITVVTTRDREGRPLGLTVSSFCSVSLHPPLVLVCVDARSETHTAFAESGVFGVSILAEGQDGISEGFARAGRAKFADIEMVAGERGAALVPGALAHIECALAAAHPAGDHTIYVGKVLSLTVRPGRPLVYHGGAYHPLGPGRKRA